MRGFSQVLVFCGLLMWCAAFHFGPESAFWKLGRVGVFLLVISLLIYLIDYLIPSGKPKRRSKARSEVARKCGICGEPALSGSTLCSYHAKYGSDNESW